MTYSTKIGFTKDYTNNDDQTFTIEAFNLKARHITLLNRNLVPAVSKFFSVFATSTDNEFKVINAVDQFYDAVDGETLDELQALLLGSIKGLDNEALNTQARIDEFFDDLGVELVQQVLMDLGVHTAKKLLPRSMGAKVEMMYQSLTQ